MRLSVAYLISLICLATALPQAQIRFGSDVSGDALTQAHSLLSQHLPHPSALSMTHKLAALSSDHRAQFVGHIESLPEVRKVRFTEHGQIVEITEGMKVLLTLEGMNFVDITNEDLNVSRAHFKEQTYPEKLSHKSKELEPLFAHIDLSTMKAFLTKFSGFYTRYYRSETGRQSQQWLLAHLKEIYTSSGSKANLTFREFEHSWTQRSIIVRFEPTKGKNPSSAPIVVLSAHQDSTNSFYFLRAPGADDDGSGTTTLVTVFEALLTEGYEATDTAVEFMFFSAEEGGLLGSGEIAQAYAREGREIRALYHMDVVAFVKQGTKPRIGVIGDNVSQPLTQFMRQLIKEYAEIDYVDTACGYGCSDHASFQKLGSPVACLSEGRFEDSNTHMHSTEDTIDIPEFSFEHIAQFARVALAYSVELGKLNKT